MTEQRIRGELPFYLEALAAVLGCLAIGLLARLGQRAIGLSKRQPTALLISPDSLLEDRNLRALRNQPLTAIIAHSKYGDCTQPIRKGPRAEFLELTY